MQFLTDFFDQAVTLPMAFCVGIAVALSGWRRGALAWAVAAALCWSSMLALKLGFDACGPGPVPGALANPSGHTASGTFVYAGILGLLAGSQAAVPAAVGAAALIGASRVALGVHSVADAIAGGAVGVACVWLLVRLAGPRPAWSRLGWKSGLIAAPLLLHGAHLGAEERIRHAAHEWAFWPLTLCSMAETTASRDPGTWQPVRLVSAAAGADPAASRKRQPRESVNVCSPGPLPRRS